MRRAGFSASFATFGRRPDRSACHWAVVALYSRPPPRVAALRRSSREIVEADRPRRRPISCLERPWTRSSAISSRSANERYRPDSGLAEDLNVDGGMPPAFRNHRAPTGADIPAANAASSLVIPFAIPDQNRWSSVRPANGGRPGDGNGARPDRADRLFPLTIATSFVRVLRRPFESALAALIRVVQQGVRLAAPPDRHDEGVGDQLSGHTGTHRPTNDAPREQIDDGCHVEPTLGRPDVGEVGDPLLVRPLRRELTIEKVRRQGGRERSPSSFGSPRRRGRARKACSRIRRSILCSPQAMPSPSTSRQTRRAP